MNFPLKLWNYDHRRTLKLRQAHMLISHSFSVACLLQLRKEIEKHLSRTESNTRAFRCGSIQKQISKKTLTLKYGGVHLVDAKLTSEKVTGIWTQVMDQNEEDAAHLINLLLTL